MPRRTRRLVTVLAAGLLAPLVAVPAAATGAYDDVIDIDFPVPDLDHRHFTDDYDAGRGGGDRHHKATDIGHADAYGLPVHAAMGGRVTQLTGSNGTPPTWGYSIRIAGDDDRDYVYIHLGRQDGPPTEAYASGLQDGDRVERGQHIGYVGHSGNASASFPHLHLEIHDPRVTDPYGSNRLNPYASLVDALDRGNVPELGEELERGGGQGPGDAPTSTRFTDVPGGYAHEDAISAIADADITEGCAPERYCPTNEVTRGQMATFLRRALDLPKEQGSAFDDVPTDHPHAGSIAAVTEAGVAQGRGNGRFAPDAPVQRDQMASFLASALELPDSGEASFPDVPAESDHAGAIAALAEARIAQGSQDGTYRPSRSTNRGQMASFLDQAFLR